MRQMVNQRQTAQSQSKIIIASKEYRITQEGTKFDLFDFGFWYTSISGFCFGPVWRLYFKRRFFGWIRKSITNDPRIVVRWKKEFFGK